MLSAKSEVQVDTAEVRVTEWRLAPGSATGGSEEAVKGGNI